MATVDLWGAEYSNVPAVDLPNGGGGTTRFHEVTGNVNISSSGVTDVTQYATATVASGTEGTPTATKGTVSNNSVSVTPSVTNTAGYVSGGTHTGTAVTVSASELVSGSQTITTNGTYDVTTLASIVAAIEGGGGGVVRENIVPQTTVTGVVNDWVRLTSGSTPSIVDGEFYSYTINGTEYVATGTTNGNIVYLSNILWDWSISGEGIGYDTQYGGIWLNVSTAGSYTVKVDKITLSGGGGGGSTLIEKTITANGTYNASDDDADGYSSVTVNVSGGSVNIGTVTTTNSSNQNTSIDFTLPSGRTPKAFFCRLTSQIARSSNSRYYYVYDMRWDGSSTGGVEGNTFYMYSGTLTNVTSGYSYSQSGTTFTLSSTGSRSASPGSFFNGTYELVYVY